jgi:hypothetical protein
MALKVTKMLIEEDVNCTLNMKMSTISLSVSKSFLGKHLFNDNVNGTKEFLKGEQWKYI